MCVVVGWGRLQRLLSVGGDGREAIRRSLADLLRIVVVVTTGTDVKTVLDYMRETHPSFTDGKKEPTLRKWILRFFKRCWRAPTVAPGSSGSAPNDVDRSYIFV